MLPDPVLLYRSYSPANTHEMREYMLTVITKNVRRMLKHKLITEKTYKKFNLVEDLKKPVPH